MNKFEKCTLEKNNYCKQVQEMKLKATGQASTLRAATKTKIEEFEGYCLSCNGMTELRNYNLSDLIPLGSGSYGDVYIHEDDTVIKIFKNNNPLNHMLREAAMYEVSFNEDENSKYIIKTLSCMRLITASGDLMVGLEMEKGGEDLFTYLERNNINPRNRLPDYYVSTFVTQLLVGVHFLHKNEIYHNDLKLENILVTPGDILKICDFGLAHCETWKRKGKPFGSLIPNEEEPNEEEKYPYFGSPSYLPSYKIAIKKEFAFKRDEWALGCLCFILCYGFMLYTDFRKIENEIFDVGPDKTYIYFADIFNRHSQILTPNENIEKLLQYFLKEKPKSIMEVAPKFVRLPYLLTE